MQKLSYSKLIEHLKASKGVSIVGLSALCDARARKTGNPYGTILKRIRAVGFVGADYGKAVNREADRQGVESSFQAESLPWGKWLIPNKVIEHNGEFYIRTQTTPGQRRKQAAKVLGYQAEKGGQLTYEAIKPFLPVSKESDKQQNAGLAETVWVRTYKFSSINRIRIAGVTYNLVNE